MEENNTVDVVYKKAKNYKRWFAFFIDIFIAFVLGLFLSSCIGAITKLFPSYQEVVKERDEIEENSSIYQDGKAIVLVMDNSDKTIVEKKEILRIAIDNFYSDTNFFSDDTYYQAYSKRKLEAKSKDGKNLFVEKEEKIVENNLSDEDYYSFYHSEIEHYCISYLSFNTRYANLSNTIVRISIIELLISLSIGYLFSFILMPLFIKRGRRTVGMYLFKISLISVEALNVRGKTLLVRDLLLYFIGYWLSIFAFFIPWAVSVTMMHLSKRGQDFFDYVSNTYVVDTEKKDVYLNYNEYLSRSGMKEKASIENDDFKLIP